MITNIYLRQMSEDDLSFVNNIRNHSSTRKNLRNTQLITIEETISWFKESKPRWHIINASGEDVGYIRTSHDTGESICIGCDIDVNKRGNGYAHSAYKIFIDQLYQEDYIVIWLEVFKNNEIAMNLYKKLGFIFQNFQLIRYFGGWKCN